MNRDAILEAVRRKFELLHPLINKRLRRHWAGCEALALPRGGITLVAQATGLSRTTIGAGIRELRAGPPSRPAADPSRRSRRPGGGRHCVEVDDPTLCRDLEQLVDPATRGDPMSP